MMSLDDCGKHVLRWAWTDCPPFPRVSQHVLPAMGLLPLGLPPTAAQRPWLLFPPQSATDIAQIRELQGQLEELKKEKQALQERVRAGTACWLGWGHWTGHGGGALQRGGKQVDKDLSGARGLNSCPALGEGSCQPAMLLKLAGDGVRGPLTAPSWFRDCSPLGFNGGLLQGHSTPPPTPPRPEKCAWGDCLG